MLGTTDEQDVDALDDDDPLADVPAPLVATVGTAGTFNLEDVPAVEVAVDEVDCVDEAGRGAPATTCPWDREVEGVGCTGPEGCG